MRQHTGKRNRKHTTLELVHKSSWAPNGALSVIAWGWSCFLAFSQLAPVLVVKLRLNTETHGRLARVESTHAGVGVGHAHVELLGALDDLAALAARHVVGDLGAVLAVVHEQHLELGHVVDHELEEAVGQQVARLLVGAVADVRHLDGALEFPAHAAVNTLRATP
ncbi:hypothetical protein ON010_g15235 [Phytophthora cinnamomi]|nr:hypothetical protein ON010_g15235 [Phytophthora cinnamomi]